MDEREPGNPQADTPPREDWEDAWDTEGESVEESQDAWEEPVADWDDAPADEWSEEVPAHPMDQPMDRPARGGPMPLLPEGPGRATAQGMLALVGIVIFAILVYVWVKGATTVGGITVLAILLFLLAVVLVVEILLTRPVFDTLFRRIPAGLPVRPDEDNFIVGCPGCGTVFTVTEDEIARGHFDCHNCGRTGYVKDHGLNTQTIHKETCPTCGNSYLEYRDDSECPVCHSFNPN